MTDKERKSCIRTIELLRRLAFNVHGVMDVIDEQNCEKIIEMLNKPEPHWIPCSERLPEPRIDVWCNSDLGQMLGYYDETIEAWYGRDFLELLVNAWMPLPEPYQPEEESE